MARREATVGGHELTRREAEVLDAVGLRLTNAEIADRLFISVRTVESHVSALLRKLGARDRRELATLAGDQLGRRRVPPLPTRLGDLASGLFIGRGHEVDHVARTLATLPRTTQRRLLLVIGEAGIGKSTLLAEAAIPAFTQGQAVLYGACEAEALSPYQPFVQAVEPLAELLPDGVTDEVAPALAPLVVSLGPAGSGTPSAEDPMLARRRLFDAFDRVLCALPSPVLLIIDDLHWADRSTWLLLQYLLRIQDGSALLIAAAVRPEALAAGTWTADFVSGMRRQITVEELRLGGLTAAAVAAICSSRALDGGMAEAVVERTGGNPLLVNEVLHHVEAAGADALATVPSRLGDMITARIRQLDAQLIDVLRAGALTGEVFRFGLAARSAGHDPASLLDALDAAVLAGLVTEVPDRSDHYRFAHAIVRDAMLTGLTTTRRIHLHLAVACELERSGDPEALADIAYHRHCALPEGDRARLLTAARQAAELASRRLAHERAAGFYSMALDAANADTSLAGERAGLHLDRGHAYQRAGERPRARADVIEAADLAAAAADHALEAHAALSLGETSSTWGDDPELVHVIERALGDVGAGEPGLRARLTARLAQARYFTASAAEREHLSSEAERLALSEGDPATLAWVLSAQHAALWGPEDLAKRLEVAHRIEQLGESARQTDLCLKGSGWLIADHLESGDAAAARDATRRHAQHAQADRDPIHMRDAAMWAAMWALLEGRLEEARALIDRGHELGRKAHDPDAETITWVQRYWVVVEAKDRAMLDELVEPIGMVAEQHARVPAWRAALATLHAKRGDLECAAAEYEQLAVDDFARIPRDVVWLNAMTYLAETCALLGDRSRAELLLDLLEPYEDRVVVIDRALVCKGSVTHYTGMLAAACGRTEGARRKLSAAVGVHAQLGAPLLEARARHELNALASR